MKILTGDHLLLSWKGLLILLWVLLRKLLMLIVGRRCLKANVLGIPRCSGWNLFLVHFDLFSLSSRFLN